MNPIVFGVLVVFGVAAIAFFIWVLLPSKPEADAEPDPAPVRKSANFGASRFERDPKTCQHEWEHWDDSYETTISYSSYGGPTRWAAS